MGDENQTELLRKALRIQDFDYSSPGAYFVTVVTQSKANLFGVVINNEFIPDEAGRMIEKWWLKISEKFLGIDLDDYVVMPNHFHGIITIVVADPCVGQEPDKRPSIPDVMQWFKTMTTTGYIQGVKQYGWPRFNGKLWQRSYYEHIVRKDDDLNRIREYIVNNPLQWGMDDENPLRELIKM
jgi:REP element-mobilizing transposase RayT